MSNAWFRFYGKFALDTDVQMMTEVDQRRLVMIMCMCNNNETLQDENIAFQLRVSMEQWQDTKAVFIAKGFIDCNNVLLKWNERQYISDSSTERVRKCRERKKRRCNVSVTPPDTDTDTDTDNNSIERAVTLAPQKKVKRNVSPKKKLSNDWRPNEELARSIADKEGFTAEQILDESKRFIEYFTGPDAKNPRKVDWDRAFRNWCGQSFCASRVSGPTARGRGSQGGVQIATALEEAATKRQALGQQDVDLLS